MSSNDDSSQREIEQLRQQLEQVRRESEQAQRKSEQAERKTEQAQRETEQARRESEQARRESEQAQRKSEQAERKSEQAQHETEQARRETEQARRESEQAQRKSEQAERKSEQAQHETEQARRETEQARRESEQAQRETEQAQRKSEQAERKSEQAQHETEQARRETEQARRESEKTQRESEKTQRESEKTQREIRDTTLEEYLTACQVHVLSKIHLVTDGYLTTRTPATNPERKHCPTLAPWSNFISIQAEMIRLLDRVFPEKERLFESLHFLKQMGIRLSARWVQDEPSLVFVQNNAIEDPVRIILSKINAFQPERFNLATVDGVEFQTTASSLRDPTDERNTLERDAKLRTDQICVFRNSAHLKDIAYVIEYKAPHKLHTSHFEQGLRQMNILEEVVNKPTIPTIEPDKFNHYAELLTAAAVTQTYHYMLEAGLEYGYLTNGDAIVFLNIDWAHPTIVRYHLARPSREVLVDQDAAYSNAVCQVLAFTMIALQSKQHSNDERVAAALKCDQWVVDFNHIVEKITKEEEEREREGGPTTPTGKKHRRVPSSPDWQPTPVKRSRRNPRQQSPPEESDRQLRSHSRHDGPGGGAGSGGGSSSGRASGSGADSGGGVPGEHAATPSASSQPAPGGGIDGQEKQRQYCTSACLLSLVRDQPLDNQCPNVALHHGTTQARHAVSYSHFMVLLRQQLSQSLDKSVKVLGKEGACGALFQMTLQQYGYTFIAKGVTGGRVPDLEKEVAVYQKLRPLQGRGIPVCLGSVDLKPLRQVFFYDFDVRIIHFILLSHGGIEVRGVGEESRKSIVNTVTSILRQMHSLGVIHGDVRWPNVLRGPDGEINVVDFDRATILSGKSRDALSAIPPKKRKRLLETEEEEKASPETKKPRLQLAIQRAIQEDISQAESLFTLDRGRLVCF